MHLGDEGLVDGLEVLLASIAIDVPINMIMHDTVWSTAKDGPDFHHPTVVLCQGGAILCRLIDSDQGHQADVDTMSSSNIIESMTEEDRVPVALKIHPVFGHPLSVITQEEDSSESSVAMAPDLDTLYDEHSLVLS